MDAHNTEAISKVSLWLEDAIAAASFLALLVFGPPLVLSLDKPVIDPIADDIAYWRRHEVNARHCRGQQYVMQCCTDARPDLTCIDANLKEKQ